MLGKNPIELPSGKKFSKEELAQALRLGIIAELDAINLYMQLASCIEDQSARRVFEDIAKEEKTHVGEFLALLKSLDQEQVQELVAGAEEVSKLAGVQVQDPPSNSQEEWSDLKAEIRKHADALRKVRSHLPVTHVGRGVDAVPVEELSSEDLIKPHKRYVIQLRELSQLFAVSQSSLDYYKKSGVMDTSSALSAATRLSIEEDKAFLGMIKEKAGLAEKLSSWDEPGSAVSEVASAIGKMAREGSPQPFVLFISPSRYAKLVSVHERTGVMELQRLKALVDVVAVPVVEDNEAILISAHPQVLDLVIGGDTELDYVGPEDGLHVFRLWETLAARIRNPRGICLMKG